MTERTDRDDAIDEVFDDLVDDELESFIFASYADGPPGSAMSFSPADKGDFPADDAPPCRIPRLELLGKLVFDFSMFFGQSPEHISEIAAHVARDHYGWSPDKTEQMWTEIAEEGNTWSRR